MSQGLDTIRDQIRSGFGDIAHYLERYDVDLDSTVISFQAGMKQFVVYVSKEFEDAPDSGQVAGDIFELATKLRWSKYRRVAVSKDGVVSTNLPPAGT
jgi:hypothetical protein